MKGFDCKIPILKVDFQDCIQVAAIQLLSFYGVEKTLSDVKKEIPVYVSKRGLTLGSSIGHMATYFLKLGFKVTMHIVDIEIFDRSWANLSKRELIKNLEKRKKFIRHPRYDAEAFNLIFEGYTTFLKSGGMIKFPIIDEKYLLNLLERGPIYAVVSYSFLNSAAKYKFVKSGKRLIKDSIKGSPGTHVVIVSGYKNGKFKITDSDPKFLGERWFKPGHLIGSIYLAETDFDPLLITLER